MLEEDACRQADGRTEASSVTPTVLAKYLQSTRTLYVNSSLRPLTSTPREEPIQETIILGMYNLRQRYDMIIIFDGQYQMPETYQVHRYKDYTSK